MLPPRWRNPAIKSSQFPSDTKPKADTTEQRQEHLVPVSAMAGKATTEDVVNEEIVEEDPEEEEEEPEEEEEEEEEEEPEEEDYEGAEVMEEDVGGQEEATEIPEPIREKRKQKEFEVFVGGLHRDATESDIEDVFKKVGEVVEVRLARVPHSNKNKGFAFVRFAAVDQAKAATELKDTVIKGKLCGVTRIKDNVTLYVGNICTSWTKDDLVYSLSALHLDNLEDVHLIDDPHHKAKNRGYAFLDFSTHMDAVAACSGLRRRPLFFGTDVRADISISKTVEPDEEVMAQVKSVFLDGFPVSWDEVQLLEHLSKFGDIESIQLARDLPNAKRQDFGFICFTTREAALSCIEKVNKDGIGEGDNKVLMKATLKKPLQKRTPSTLGVRTGYIGKEISTRGRQSYGFASSFRDRPSRSYQLMGRGFHDRSRAPRGRGAGFRAAMSTRLRKFGSRLRRGISREIPVIAAPESRHRDPYYYERSSSSQHSLERHHYYSTAYSQMRRPSEPIVEHHETCEYDDTPIYEYDDTRGYEQPYFELDHDMPVSYSQPGQGRGRSGYEMAAYQEHEYPTYDDYSRRFSPDEQLGYERVEYASRGHARQYYSGRGGTSRQYYSGRDTYRR